MTKAKSLLEELTELTELNEATSVKGGVKLYRYGFFGVSKKHKNKLKELLATHKNVKCKWDWSLYALSRQALVKIISDPIAQEIGLGGPSEVDEIKFDSSIDKAKWDKIPQYAE